MRMVPGSHRGGRVAHRLTEDATNVPHQGQAIDGVSEAAAVMRPPGLGEASLHHGWTLHASTPNAAADRRISLNAQYLAPHLRQTRRDLDSAILVRGEDRYGHFAPDEPAAGDRLPQALARWGELQRLHEATQGSA